MPIALDSHVKFAAEDQDAPATTDPWVISSAADRWAIGAMYARDFGTPAAHNSMSLEGVSMTQLGSTADVELDASTGVSRWNLIAPASGSDRTLSAVLSVMQSVGMLLGAVYSGVHQTTPISSTPTPTEGAFDSVTTVTPNPAITGTTVAGGKLIAVLAMTNSNAAIPSAFSGTGVTVVDQAHINGMNFYILEKDDTSGSTTIDLTVSFAAAASGIWRLDAYAIQPSAGGGSGIAKLAALLRRQMRN